VRLFFAILRFELRLQLRSPRVRLGVLLYPALCALPPALLYFDFRHRVEGTLGATSYLAPTLAVQPFLTALLAVMVAGNRSGRGAVAELWSPLSAASLGSAGFLLRRWLAGGALLLPLTLLPAGVAAGFAVAGGYAPGGAGVWLWSWLLEVVPVAMVVSAGWLALVTVTGGELPALLLAAVGGSLARAVANQLLFPFRLTLAGGDGWLGLGSLVSWIQTTVYYWIEPSWRQYHPGFVATEAPYDPASATALLLPRLVLPAAAALAVLALATLFLGRTRRDLRPLPVRSSHPLRTYLELWNRFRHRHAPDAATGRAGAAALALALLLPGAALAFLVDRQLEHRRLADARYRAWTEAAFEPLPRAVRPASWRFAGTVGGDGGAAVALDGAGRLEHRGREPVASLALTLDEALELADFEVVGRRGELRREGDRLRVALDPPLAPGEAVELRWRVAGRPGELAFGLATQNRSFVEGYERLRGARFPRELTDLSRAVFTPALSPRRIRLGPGQLGPVPRYTPWTLTPPADIPGMPGREVPAEEIHPEGEVAVDLRLPGGRLVASSCGDLSRPDGDGVRLAGGCRAAVTAFEVRGGDLVATPATPAGAGRADGRADGRAVVTLPAHRPLAGELARGLAAVSELADRAWPGLGGLGRLVVMEWPPPFSPDLTSGLRHRWYEGPGEELLGRLLAVSEGQLIGDRPLRAEEVVARVLSAELLRRRQVADAESHVFENLFRALMLRRMGLTAAGSAGPFATGPDATKPNTTHPNTTDPGATVSGPPWVAERLARPILEAHPFDGMLLRRRLPAVLVEVESRVGSAALYGGVEDFLAGAGSADGAAPGTIRELLAAVEARSGVSLERMYQDYFAGTAVPSTEGYFVRRVAPVVGS